MGACSVCSSVEFVLINEFNSVSSSMKRPSNLKPKKEEHHAKSLLDHQAQVRPSGWLFGQLFIAHFCACVES